MVDPLRRLANTVGRDSKLSTRGTLVDGELRSAQGPGSAPPVWFVFTGTCAAIAHMCDAIIGCELMQRLQLSLHNVEGTWPPLVRAAADHMFPEDLYRLLTCDLVTHCHISEDQHEILFGQGQTLRRGLPV